MPNPATHISNREARHRWAFLVNPVSGSGAGRTVHESLPGLLRELGLEDSAWTLSFSESGENLPRQVSDLSSSVDRVVVAGGDGTIGLSLEGLRRSNSGHCALGVIPLGTGNDLARELGLFETYEQQGLRALLELFLLDRTAPLDLWDVGGTATMVNYLSLGLDGKSTESFARTRELGKSHSVLLNKARFARAGLSSLSHFLPSDFRLRLHRGEEFQDLNLGGKRTVAIHNVSNYAAGLLRVAETRPDDGLLTVTCFPTMASYLGLMFRRLFSKGRVGAGQLPFWKADRISCSWSGDVGLQLDGEGREDLRCRGSLDIRHAGRVMVLSGQEYRP
ncbi:MAG: hypothetical protein H6686_03250 [Fibrobacteria bacterium]|nr:hypothetical protein [Fibrobacteria bacterium]